MTAEIDATLKRAFNVAIGIIVDQDDALVRVATALVNERKLSDTRIAELLNADQTGNGPELLTTCLGVPMK